jgi:hypothetical protein
MPPATSKSIHPEEGGLDGNDEGEVGSEEEVVQLIMETEGSVPDTINDQHQLNPDIRLVRNIHGRRGILRRELRM